MSGWLLVAAGAAAAAVPLLITPAARTARLRVDETPPARGAVERWLAGREDGLSARLRWGGGVVAAIAALALLEAAAPVRVLVGAVTGLLVVGMLGRLQSPAARREQEAIVLALPEALDLLAACLRSGLPVRRASEEVAEATPGPLARRLRLVAAAIRVGTDDATAWLRLADDPHLGRMARDLARASTSGAALATSLERLGVEARAARTGVVEARARTTGVRSVLPLMVCFLPAFLLVGVVPIIGSMLLRMLTARG